MLAAGLRPAPACAAEPIPVPPEQFDTLINPQPSELLFQQIPWLLSVHDARVKAAPEGKPIGPAAALGVC